MRSVGVLVAVARVADRLLDLHPLPVGIELVGHDQRQRVRMPVPISERCATMNTVPSGSMPRKTLGCSIADRRG